MQKVVLVGNPNVGKSIFFHAFTGIYREVSNFPGTTVDVGIGKFLDNTIYDTPGIYGVSAFNDEERVARDIILKADIVINVADGLHLSRDLFLTQQLIDMGKPVILCINMIDEVEKHHVRIDHCRLEVLLGIPVILTSATDGLNLNEVKSRFPEARCGKKIPEIENEVGKILPLTKGNFAHALLLCEDDDALLRTYRLRSTRKREWIYSVRRQHVNEIVEKVVKEEESGGSKVSGVDRFLLNPILGLAIMLIVLGFIFLFLGYFVAQKLVYLTEGVFMEEVYAPFIRRGVSFLIGENTFLGRLLIGEFGLLTMVPTYLFGLLLPLVFGFYLMLSVLEDSGYLPRIAVLSDKLLSKIGLNGRAVIPFILGFGCVTAATVSTRLLGSKRERIIATTLLCLAVPCSAQFGVILGSFSRMGLLYSLLYVLIILSVFALSGWLLNRFLNGNSTDLLIDLPPMRIPKAGNLFKKIITKTIHFLYEAAPIFAFGAVLITTMSYFGLLDGLIQVFSPVVTGFLHLPEEMTLIFLMGLFRRDFGAAALNSVSLTAEQTLVSVVTLTLFVPCIATVIMIFKERSKGEALFIWLASLFSSFLIGGFLSNLLILLNQG